MIEVRKKKCPDRGFCDESDCDFYIADIRFRNCSLKVDTEMSIDEIVTATGWSKNTVLSLLQSALEKIKIMIELNKDKRR